VLKEKSYAPLMPLMPRAFRNLRFDSVDAVIASHHAFATQAAMATDAPVIAYVHSPARWAWDPSLRAGEGGGKAGEAILTALSVIAKRGETKAAPRLRTIVANSTAVAGRISDWWHRDSVVVPPPVDTEGYTPDPSIEREDFFLLAGRLVPYKRPDLAIRAAAAAGVPLVVAGDGRSMKICQDAAGPKTTFLGRVSHEKLLDLHRRTRALLMPGIEDFGIVPVESMATGTPVIALGEGGAIDSVVPGVTGEHVEPGSDQQIVDRFASSMRSFDPAQFDPVAIRQWAEGFSRMNFRRRMQEVVDAAV
jgi:glycosyltransferase involved in cell wall biosynthesis